MAGDHIFYYHKLVGLPPESRGRPDAPQGESPLDILDVENSPQIMGAINRMTLIVEGEGWMLDRRQCIQMVREFKHMYDVLIERESLILGADGDKFTRILNFLFHLTCVAIEVLNKCSCRHRPITQDNMTWLQAAITHSDMTFRMIWNELKWCLNVFTKIGASEETTLRFRPELIEGDRNKLFNQDKDELKMKLEKLLVPDLHQIYQASDILQVVRYLLLRLNNNEDEYIFFLNRLRPQSLDDDVTGTVLGSGATGYVIATNLFGTRVAKKIFPNSLAIPCLLESKIMAKMSHPHVIRFISCCSDPQRKPAILMEISETSLGAHLEEHSRAYKEGRRSVRAPFDTMVTVDIVYQIALGMQYLHENGIAHCDIKPQNILINRCMDNSTGVSVFDGYYHVKITDFGHSKSGIEAYDCLVVNSIPGRGTTTYRAPELEPKKKSNVCLMRADIFSFGLTFWQIFHVEIPLGHVPLSNLSEMLAKGMRPIFDPEFRCPKSLKNLIQQCWHATPYERPTFSQICLHLQEFKKALMLGSPSEGLISPSNGFAESNAKQRWKVLQTYKIGKTLIERMLCPRHMRNSRHEEDFKFPGDDCSEGNIAFPNEEDQKAVQSICERRSLAPWYSYFRPWRARGCFSQRVLSEDVFTYSG